LEDNLQFQGKDHYLQLASALLQFMQLVTVSWLVPHPCLNVLMQQVNNSEWRQSLGRLMT